MDHVAIVAGFAALFVATHIGLATSRIRTALVSALGDRGFTVFYFLVAAATYSAFIMSYAAHRLDGPAGADLGATALRWPLILVIVTGMMLMSAGLLAYPGMPSALFGQTVRPPRGVERITRHPFFAGTAMMFLAHTLLAPRLTGAVFSLSIAILAIVGAWHQDRKLHARRGSAYGDYLAATSGFPFAAIVSGRQRLVPREQPLGAYAAGAVAAVALRMVHGSLFADGGLWVIVAVLGGAGVAGAQSARRARRGARRDAAPHAAAPIRSRS